MHAKLSPGDVLTAPLICFVPRVGDRDLGLYGLVKVLHVGEEKTLVVMLDQTSQAALASEATLAAARHLRSPRTGLARLFHGKDGAEGMQVGGHASLTPAEEAIVAQYLIWRDKERPLFEGMEARQAIGGVTERIESAFDALARWAWERDHPDEVAHMKALKAAANGPKPPPTLAGVTATASRMVGGWRHVEPEIRDALAELVTRTASRLEAGEGEAALVDFITGTTALDRRQRRSGVPLVETLERDALASVVLEWAQAAGVQGAGDLLSAHAEW